VQDFYVAIADLAPPANRDQLRDLRTSLGDPMFVAGFATFPMHNSRVRNTIAVTMLEGSNKVNVVPNQATAQLDVRLLPGEDPKAFVAELRRVIADDTIRIEGQARTAGGSSPLTHEFFRVITDLARKADPQAVVTPTLLTAASDCRFFRARGIPCYGYQPFTLSGKDYDTIHGNDERISLKNVSDGVQILYDLVRGLAAP
jgi:acetylornithine deacetylase/succinyl-diaminopimelate desuccinylase-like protein